MIVIGVGKLKEFGHLHGDVRSQLDTWRCEAEEAAWRTPSDIKARYSSASFLADNRVIFNIKGNRYRLDTHIAYHLQTVIIKRIGTHAEYSKWDF